MKHITFTIGLFLLALNAGLCDAPQADGTVLAPGNPPLTEEMVQHRIAVLESFLDVHLNADQKQVMRESMVNAWQHKDAKQMQNILGDVKFYGDAGGLQAAREKNLESYVEDLRKHPEKADDAMLLSVFEAAHPDHRDVMHARGLGDLVGDWVTGDALPATHNPITGRSQGISFSEALVLKIFSDGRFHHEWVDRFCGNGARCCRESGTTADGTLAVEGSALMLNTSSVAQINRDPCMPANNVTNATGPEHPAFEWSVKHGPSGKQMLCLSQRPFQFTQKTEAVCYTKEQ